MRLRRGTANADAPHCAAGSAALRCLPDRRPCLECSEGWGRPMRRAPLPPPPSPISGGTGEEDDCWKGELRMAGMVGEALSLSAPSYCSDPPSVSCSAPH